MSQIVILEEAPVVRLGIRNFDTFYFFINIIVSTYTKHMNVTKPRAFVISST